MIHDFFPTAITIGEDVSGMPTFCRPWTEGGVGFDYRLNVRARGRCCEGAAVGALQGLLGVEAGAGGRERQ